MARQEKSVHAGTISLEEDLAPKSRRDLKRDTILAAAKEMFFAQGYSGVSMDDIVARVSGSKATLYSHFPSKDQLLLALVEEATVGAISEAVHPDPGQDFSAFLRNYGRIGMRWRTSANVVGLERLAASEALRFPEFGRTCYEQGVLPNRQLAADIFANAMDRGVLRRTDPLLATDQFMGMCAGWMWRRQIWGVTGAPGTAQINANVDAAVETFVHGYANRGARGKKKAIEPTQARVEFAGADPCATTCEIAPGAQAGSHSRRREAVVLRRRLRQCVDASRCRARRWLESHSLQPLSLEGGATARDRARRRGRAIAGCAARRGRVSEGLSRMARRIWPRRHQLADV